MVDLPIQKFRTTFQKIPTKKRMKSQQPRRRLGQRKLLFEGFYNMMKLPMMLNQKKDLEDALKTSEGQLRDQAVRLRNQVQRFSEKKNERQH